MGWFHVYNFAFWSVLTISYVEYYIDPPFQHIKCLFGNHHFDSDIISFHEINEENIMIKHCSGCGKAKSYKINPPRKRK
jgi:hypothetical protein